MKPSMAAFLMIILFVASVPANAHHSLAEVFDRESPITLAGAVTAVQWVNPHVLFYIDVEDEDGNVENWGLEMDGPGFLESQGWKLDLLKLGDVVTVIGFGSKDSSPKATARTVTLSTGQSLSATTDNSWNWSLNRQVPVP